MNEKVENLIKEEKARLWAIEQQQRDNHLIRLGLIDESKSNKKYQDYFSEDAKFDPETNLYYKAANLPLEVTDEEYAEICKYFPLTKAEESVLKTGPEKTLNIIANVTLVCGIIGALILFFTNTLIFDRLGNLDSFGPAGLVIAFGVLSTSLITWSVLRTFSDISTNIRQVNAKIK